MGTEYRAWGDVAVKGLRVTAAGGVVRVQGRGEDWLAWENAYDRTLRTSRAYDPIPADVDGADAYRQFRDHVAVLSSVASKDRPPHGSEAAILVRQARSNGLIDTADVKAYGVEVQP